MQEEIESVKEALTNLHSGADANDDECGTVADEEEPQYDTKQIKWEDLEDLDPSELENEDQNEYRSLVNQYANGKGGGDDMAKRVRVISPYDFDTLDDYKIVELTYYADGVLEDEDGDIVDDVEELIGSEALGTFGEYEDDAVFVRNDYLETDIQILKDYRTYEEARSINGPQRVYDE
jgi:hypothetical protein